MRVISWEEFIGGSGEGERGKGELALTVGVFDGIHLGHQSLIRKICEPPDPTPAGLAKASPLIRHTVDIFRAPALSPEKSKTQLDAVPAPGVPTVVTFTRNPLEILNPAAFTGDIYPLEQKLAILEELEVKLTVLIDFSEKFSKIDGRDFIDRLLSQPVKLLVLGPDFRCGRRLDTGLEEIQRFAQARGVAVWVAPPVMDCGQPVSSSRIRQAMAAGNTAEAERLLGRSLAYE